MVTTSIQMKENKDKPWNAQENLHNRQKHDMQTPVSILLPTWTVHRQEGGERRYGHKWVFCDS